MGVDFTFGGTVKIPLCVAPMFLVSSPELVLAANARGVMSGFPAHATRNFETFVDWLDAIERAREAMDRPAPYAVNLVVHHTNQRLEGDLDLCVRRRAPIILTSKGAPRDVFERIHDYGGLVFHDVASARHAEKAAQAGADAVIAIAGGAGGKTGTINPFALLNEIRQATDVPILLAGGMSTGRDVLAAELMGASMAYVGTRFIATKESLADDYTRQVMIDASAKDIFFTRALGGAPQNWVKPTLIAEGYDPDALAVTPPGAFIPTSAAKARYSKVKSAGQGVGMIKAAESAADLCDRMIAEYHAAREDLARRL
ncbi:MAG: nitronate monooxygenase [Caulobacterales bacterium]|nr:nitronate monooxygenase [Caulobacterales bacterium]